MSRARKPDPGLVLLQVINDVNREAVLALRVAPAQERFVSTVRRSLAEAAEHPHARPWYRAAYAGDEPVGFVMLSWNVEAAPTRDHRALVPVEAAHRRAAPGPRLRLGRSFGRSLHWCAPRARRSC